MIQRGLELLAYIDPGVGSIVIQAVLAMALSMGIIFRRVLFFPFAMLFRRNVNSENSTVDADD